MLRPRQPYRPLRAEDLPSTFTPPPHWNGEMVVVEHGPYVGRRGYPDNRGNIWVPTRPGESHGGPHFDVQLNGGRSKHLNIYPEKGTT